MDLDVLFALVNAAKSVSLDQMLVRASVMDVDGGVRGSMLQTSLECLIGVAEGDSEAAHILLAAARSDHDGYGVTEDQVDLLFVAMRDTFRVCLGPDWSPEMETEWAALLEKLSRIGKQGTLQT